MSSLWIVLVGILFISCASVREPASIDPEKEQQFEKARDYTPQLEMRQ